MKNKLNYEFIKILKIKKLNENFFRNKLNLINKFRILFFLILNIIEILN